MKKSSKILSVLIISFILTAILRLFVFEGFIVIGDSMEPTIHSGDYIFISKISLSKREPQRGDIVVVTTREQRIRIIKRIVGMPGERISIEEGKIVLREKRTDEGKVLAETYLGSSTTTPNGTPVIKMDPGEYFALGDNRAVSIDSREVGPIDKWDIKGLVIGAFNLKTFKFRFL